MYEPLGPSAGAQQRGSSYGTIGDISTDELLERRLQRQQAERRAHMATQGRSSFARRPMAPVQPSSNQQRTTQVSSKIEDCSVPAAANPLSRATKRALENSLSASTAAAAVEQPVGVSADELAKLLDDTAGDDGGPAKRLKLSDLAPANKQQKAAEGTPVVPARACFLTHKVLDPTTTIAAACQRVAAQHREQELAAQAAARAATDAAATKEAAEAAAKAQAAAEAAALAGKQAQSAEGKGPSAIEPQDAQRWKFKQLRQAMQKQQQQHVKGSGTTNLLPQKAAASAAVTAAAGTSRRRKLPVSLPAAAPAADVPRDSQSNTHGRACASKKATARPSIRRHMAPVGETPACPPEADDEEGIGQELPAAAATAVAVKAGDGDITPAASRRRSQRGQRANKDPGDNLVKTAPLVVDPMRHLSAVTLEAPSRRVRQLHSAAAEAKAAEGAEHSQQKAPVSLKANMRSAGSVKQRARAPAQAQQQHPKPQQPQQQEQKHCVAAGHQQDAALPSPLARKIAVTAANAADHAAAAEDATTLHGAATAGAGCGSHGEMMLLDSDDEIDDLLGDAVDRHQPQAPSTAEGFAAGEAAAWFAARVAAAGAERPVAVPACQQEFSRLQQLQAVNGQQPQEQQDEGQQQGGCHSSLHGLCKRQVAAGQDERYVSISNHSRAASAVTDDEQSCSSDDMSEGSDDDADAGSRSSSGWEESDEQDMPPGSSSGGEQGYDDEPQSSEHDSGGEAAAAAAAFKAKSIKKGIRRVRKAAATCQGQSRHGSTRRKAAAAGAAGENDSQQEGSDGDEAASVVKKRSRKRAAAADAGSGAAKKKATTAAKPRAKKVTHRQNFKRHKSNGTGYSCKFVSKSAAHAGRRPFRRVVNGKLIRGRRKAPHMVGQGSEFLEGFSGGASGGGGMAGRGRCFKCGQAGHWETDCPLNAAAIAAQEAEMAAWRTAQLEKEREAVQGQGQGMPADPAATAAEAGDAVAGGGPAAAGYPKHKAAAAQQAPAAPPPPLSHAELCSIVGQDASQPWQPEQLTDDQLRVMLKSVWGYEQFRGQQLPLIRAALQGRSMLGVLPTGLGKSLTYQLPAILLQGLVVVVSPLLALMRDQVTRLPAGLPGAMLQGSMTRQEVEQILTRAESGQLRLLYVAPEKLSAGPVLSCLRRLSPLPLVCVDEAHCMAEWGQGFRPAYFRLGHLLCNVLCPRAVLALTATATPPTRACIRQLLAIPLGNQIVESPLRDNLRLRVLHCNGASKGGGIAAGVVQLLTTGELSSCRSIVVYTGTRFAADALAAQLQRAAVAARPYHAGMRQQQRELVQAAFTSGALRVVVATVAFGMGVDKQDLDAVLHTSLPHSLEEYVQQVGRAGRNGRTGHCMAFLDDADYVRLRALVHSGMARKEGIEVFLTKVFGREVDTDDSDDDEQTATVAGGAKKKRHKKKQKLAPSQHRALPLQATCSELDTSEEVLECCLSFLQADPVEPYLVALPNAAATIDVRFHRRTAEELAANHPVVASILAAKTRKYAGTYKVHLDALVSVADRPPGELLSELVGLATAQEVGFDLGSQGALVWRLERQPEDWQQLVDNMTHRLDQIIRASASRLDRCYFALAGATIYSSQGAQERHLRAMIDEYFMDAPGQPQEQAQQPNTNTPTPAAASEPAAAAELTGGDLVQEAMQSGEMPWGGSCPVLRPSRDSLLRQLRAAVHNVSRRAMDLGRAKFTGLTLTRMLAGLSSPAVPATVWKGCHEWATMAAVDFRLLAEVAEEVVAEFWANAG